MIWKQENDKLYKSNVNELLDFTNSKSILSFDTETRGFDPHTCELLLYQIGDYSTQFIVDATKYNNLLLKEIFDNNKLWLLQNAKFDLRFLIHQDVYPKNIYDTFLAECVIYTGYNFKDDSKPYFVDTSLKGLVKKYCNVDLDKTIRGKIHKENNSERVIKYAANDVKYLATIRKFQLEQIESLQLGRTINLENEVVKVFA